MGPIEPRTAKSTEHDATHEPEIAPFDITIITAEAWCRSKACSVPENKSMFTKMLMMNNDNRVQGRQKTGALTAAVATCSALDFSRKRHSQQPNYRSNFKVT